MMSFITVISTLAILFCLSHHPLTMALILMLNTLAMSLMSGMMNLSYWYSFMLFMIMIGGMLVLVMYMTSVSSNEMTESPWKGAALIFMALAALMMYEPLALYLPINTQETLPMTSLMTNLSLSKFICKPHLATILVMINYLLITLIAIVKITDKSSGALRQKF